MSLNDTAAHFLKTYAAGGEVEEGWLYARALQQSHLDFSAESLGRLDQLLRQARERARPSRAQLESAKGRNFVSLVGFYAIEMLRRLAGVHLEWHERESAVRMLPPGTQVPQDAFARLLLIGPDQGAAFWPLSWVESQVLPDGQRVPAREYIDGLMQMLERNAPVAWWQAADAVGRLASWQMMWTTLHGTAPPTLLNARMPTTWQVMASSKSPDAGVHKTVEEAAKLLETNADNAAWQALSYDGFLEDQGRRIDAMMVIACTYGDRPLRMKIAFPYRPAVDGQPFAILQPRLRDANVDNEKIAMLQAALERGIHSVKWMGESSWDALRGR